MLNGPSTSDSGWKRMPENVKFMLLDISKLKNVRWRHGWNSKEGVRKLLNRFWLRTTEVTSFFLSVDFSTL